MGKIDFHFELIDLNKLDELVFKNKIFLDKINYILKKKKLNQPLSFEFHSKTLMIKKSRKNKISRLVTEVLR